MWVLFQIVITSHKFYRATLPLFLSWMNELPSNYPNLSPRGIQMTQVGRLTAGNLNSIVICCR